MDKTFWNAIKDLTRPFTLVYPFVAVVAAAICALGFYQVAIEPAIVVRILLCAFAASLLNAASNALNQISDLEIDRINKPDRPLSSGRLTVPVAWIFSVITYSMAFVLFITVDLMGGVFCALIGGITIVLTYIYSFGLRTKNHWMSANLTIGLGRGLLVVLIGWSVVGPITTLDPFIIGGTLGLFLFGAAASKDFSDMEGDRAHNCRTLPVMYGARRASWIMAPFLIVPFLLNIAALSLGWLNGAGGAVVLVSVLLCLWGCFVAYLILRDPKAMCTIENHPSWMHMYLLLMVAQVGYSFSYL